MTASEKRKLALVEGRTSPPPEARFEGLNREEMKAFFESHKFGLNAISGSVGLSKSCISQWFNGIYPGDWKGVGDRLVGLRKLVLEQKLRPAPAGEEAFLETSVAKAVFGVCRMTHLDRTMGVVYGASGLGKSRAAREYARRNPGTVILLECHVLSNIITVLEALARQVGVDGNGALWKVLDRTVTELKGTGRMVIVDEAQFLAPKALETLRCLNDQGTPIVLIGMPRLYNRMLGRNTELYAQIHSRVGAQKQVRVVTSQDVDLLLDAFGIEEAEIRDMFQARRNTPGHLRTVVMALRKVDQMTRATGKTPTKAMVNEAFGAIFVGEN